MARWVAMKDSNSFRFINFFLPTYKTNGSPGTFSQIGIIRLDISCLSISSIKTPPLKCVRQDTSTYIEINFCEPQYYQSISTLCNLTHIPNLLIPINQFSSFCFFILYYLKQIFKRIFFCI